MNATRANAPRTLALMFLRRRYHLGLPGVVFCAITLMLGIGAATGQNNLLFLAFGLALAAIVVSGIISGSMMMGVEVAREAPEQGAVGRPLTLCYTVRNRSRWLPVFALSVEEWERKRSRRGVRAGWSRLMPPPRTFLMHLGPGQSAHLAATVEPRRRGEATLLVLRVSSSFPFGIFTKATLTVQRATVLILPRVDALRHDVARDLAARAHTGLSSTSITGRGDEFYGVRDYAPGDSMRAIAWKPSARTGDLVVRENSRPTSGSLLVVLNLNGSGTATGDGPLADEQNERAISLAASLAVAANRAGLDVGIAAPDLGVSVAPATSARQSQIVLGALARLDPEAPRSLANGAAVDVARWGSRCASVVVHAAGIDPAFGPPGARHLSANDLERVIVAGAAPLMVGAAEEAGA